MSHAICAGTLDRAGGAYAPVCTACSWVLLFLAGFAATVSGGETQVQAHWVIRDLGTLGGK